MLPAFHHKILPSPTRFPDLFAIASLAYSCPGCNNHKYTSVEAPDPLSGRRAVLFHPRSHQWRDHFTWGEDVALIRGLTPTGRATIEKLRLNRPHVVNLRRLMALVGQHPPPDDE